MLILLRMHRWQKLDGWRWLNAQSGKVLPLVMPWILVPCGFLVVGAFMHACANNSVQEILMFVVIPLALWTGFSQMCSTRVYGPDFAPSSVAALITIMAATHSLHISSATSRVYNIIFASACGTLGAAFWRMIVSDPGRIVLDSSVSLSTEQQHLDIEDPGAVRYPDSFSTVMEVDERGPKGRNCNICNIKQPLRSKHCKYCNVCIERFDHHCPAIYNCVGRKNHVSFLGMLVAFILVEALYVNSCLIYIQFNHLFEDQPTSDGNVSEGDVFGGLVWLWQKILKVLSGDPWVLSTASFAGLQILWQVPLLIFHIYGACCNLTSDEMFHWDKYPGLYVESPPAPFHGRPFVGKDFVNPYTRGVRQNLISFFKGQT